MNEQNIYWLALNMVNGVGAVRFKTLLDHFGDAESAWRASESQLRSAGLGYTVINNLIKLRDSLDFDRLTEDLEKNKVETLTWEDEQYPKRLLEIDQAPPVLYLRGKLLQDDDWAVAVVGTRRLTAYGRQVAEELGAFLAHQGITVISGMARGIDAAVQQSALNAGGRSLGVLAHGLDRIYPAEHRELAEQVAARGALISDYPLGVPPDSTNFPPRNRIISGLSMATVVVEAGYKSGALITAEFAVEQGREVFAIPGNMYAAQSKGTNRLIQQGAHPLLNFEQLLEVLDLEQMTHYKSARVVLPEDATEAKLFEVLSREPLHVDEIGALAELPIEQVSSTLALMELKGIVRQVGGMNYVAVRELKAEYHADSEQ